MLDTPGKWVMHDGLARRGLRRWWIWPLAVITLGWALFLSAHVGADADGAGGAALARVAALVRVAPAPDHANVHVDANANAKSNTNTIDRPVDHPSKAVTTNGRVLVEHALALRPPVPALGGTARATHWLLPVVDAGWRKSRPLKHVLIVPVGDAALHAFARSPEGPWAVTPKGTPSDATVAALRREGLHVDASTTLVQWHDADAPDAPVDPLHGTHADAEAAMLAITAALALAAVAIAWAMTIPRRHVDAHAHTRHTALTGQVR